MSAPARLLLVAGGAGALLAGPVAPVAAVPSQPAAALLPASEPEAVALLAASARAVAGGTWSGRQQATTWPAGGSSTVVVAVAHRPDTGTSLAPVAAAPGRTRVVPDPAPDPARLARLAARYRLAVVGDSTCAGRAAHVVEARRADGRVAARWCLDRDTALPLRSEVWDARGARVRTTALTDLRVEATGAAPVAAERGLPAAAAAQAPFPVPAELPGGYLLVASARPVHDGTPVLHLTYADGLSTVAVFAQPGAAGSGPGDGWSLAHAGGADVWVLPGTPERLVWGGAGQVLTIVSDAPHEDLLAAVAALPHDPRTDDGALPRLRRGAARVASWVDPTA